MTSGLKRDAARAGGVAEAPQRQRADIQGLRAVAVLAVVVNHANHQWLPGGYVGVDVFFVISGYLITSQLLRRIDRDGTINFRSFYAARIRRLLPMSVLVLVATLVACRLLLPPLTLVDVSQDATATALYLSNMLFARQGTDYLADQSPSVFQHFWSLALEEQFYVFWPLVLLVAHRLLKSRRATAGLVLGLVVASFTLCVLLTDYAQPWAFFTLPARAWELAIGALVALAAARLARWRGLSAVVLGWAGLVGILASLLTFSGTTAFPGYAVALPVASTALVIAAGVRPGAGGPQVVLGRSAFQWVGDRSYSLYLWHWPVLLIPAIVWGPLSVVEVLGLLVLAASLSAVSYVLVEERVRHARTLVTKPSWALGLGGVLTAVSLAIAVSVSWIGPLHAGRPAEALTPGQLATGIPAPAYVPSNLTPTLRGATQDNPALYAQGCHVDFAATEPKPGCVFVDGNDGPRVALLGDSHAAQWFPALEAAVAEAGGSLLSLTKSACPSYDVAVVNDALEREYRECDQWRTAAIEEAQSWGADLVVLGNFGSGYESRILGDEDFVEQWAAGVSSTIQQFGQTPVVVLGDTPRWPTPVNVCVSGALDDPSSCAKPRAELTRPDIASAEAAAASAAGATYVDTASWLCGEMCEPIAGHALVYRDESHMTATFAALLAPLIGRELGL